MALPCRPSRRIEGWDTVPDNIIETQSQAPQLEGEAAEEAAENQLVENPTTNDDSSNACTSLLLLQNETYFDSPEACRLFNT